MPSGPKPDALHELHLRDLLVGGTRNRKTGPRQSGLKEPEHMANVKECAPKASAEQLQVV